MNRIVMSQRFLKAFTFTKSNEGNFSNNPHDKGGKTIYGVSSKYFPEVFQTLIDSKPEEVEEVLKAFYYTEFWNDLYEQIFFEPLSIRLFDLSVNLGKKRAISILQETFNKLSQDILKTDGIFGRGTLRAVNLPPIVHPNFYLRYQKNVEAYYRSLADFDVFGKGWTNRLYRSI